MSTTTWPIMSSELQLSVMIETILDFQILVIYWRNQCKPPQTRISQIFFITLTPHSRTTSARWLFRSTWDFKLTIPNVWAGLWAKIIANGWVLLPLRCRFRSTVTDKKWSFLAATLSKFITFICCILCFLNHRNLNLLNKSSKSRYNLGEMHS